jgi:uncharacterized protein
MKMGMLYLPVTLATAGAAALISVWLGLRISLRRRSRGISLGDGGDATLTTRMRAQLNFVEYTPIVLILIGLVESARGSSTWLWAVAAAYIVARLLHAIGMERNIRFRQIGIVTTWAVLIGMGLYAAVLPFTAPAVPAAVELVPMG